MLETLGAKLKPGGAWQAFGTVDEACWDSSPPQPVVSKDDFIVTVSAGMRLDDLQAHLEPFGLALPFVPIVPSPGRRLGEWIGQNVPHQLEGTFRSWRDWVLGGTMLLSDGSVARSGARVTKSVAGFDAHQLPIGTHGTLVVPVELHLRVVAASRVAWPAPVQHSGPFWIQRVLRTDFEAACQQSGLLWSDPETATCALSQRPGFCPEHSWWMDERGVGPLSPLQRETWLRAKAQFDPDGRLAGVPE